MKQDLTLPCGDGLVTIRVGAVIIKNGRLLMAGNDREDYLYSVGGRVQFGETAEDAIIREVYEETGIHMDIDRLAAVHENYFYGDAPSNMGKLIYEISFFFLMKVPEDFEPVSKTFFEGEQTERLFWVSPDTEKVIYPFFFRTEDFTKDTGLKHFVTDDREQ